MTFAAMFALTPRRVMAGSQATGGVIIFGGTDYRTGDPFVSYEVNRGGFGARPTKDGINAISSTIANTMNTPVEVMELSFPLRIEEYAIKPDSGGAGTWRGGMASRRGWRVLERDATATTGGERMVSPAFGLAGGHAGGPARVGG